MDEIQIHSEMTECAMMHPYAGRTEPVVNDYTVLNAVLDNTEAVDGYIKGTKSLPEVSPMQRGYIKGQKRIRAWMDSGRVQNAVSVFNEFLFCFPPSATKFEFHVVAEEGPPHAKKFAQKLWFKVVDFEQQAVGSGKSKGGANADACFVALHRLYYSAEFCDYCMAL